MPQPEPITVMTSDGRALEVLVEGPDDGSVVLYHSGTPSGAARLPYLSDAAADRGLRLVSYSRPGYGTSRPDLGRRVASAAADSAAILDALGVERFSTLGWSGGGPHALACAALLPERCSGAALLAGVAPHQAEGLDWLGGMGPENVEEFGAAMVGVKALTTYLDSQREHLRNVTADQVAEALGGLAPEVDRSAITGDFAEYLAESFQRAMLSGIEGWRDDDLAFVAPWGFDLDAITVPVAVWQGGADLMVPFAHGLWLTEHVAGARSNLFADEGHLSLMERVGDILDDLIARPTAPV